MTGIIVFGVLVVAGLAALIVLKIRWARQASRKWAAITVSNNAYKD